MSAGLGLLLQIQGCYRLFLPVPPVHTSVLQETNSDDLCAYVQRALRLNTAYDRSN